MDVGGLTRSTEFLSAASLRWHYPGQVRKGRRQIWPPSQPGFTELPYVPRLINC